jgi:hypothetical protein
LDAAVFTRYPVSATAFSTAARVDFATTEGFDKARLTVAVETPATRATS